MHKLKSFCYCIETANKDTFLGNSRLISPVEGGGASVCIKVDLRSRALFFMESKKKFSLSFYPIHNPKHILRIISLTLKYIFNFTIQ